MPIERETEREGEINFVLDPEKTLKKTDKINKSIKRQLEN